MFNTAVSERRLNAFICRQLGIAEAFEVDKEGGVLWLTGGAGQDVSILPADPESWVRAEVVSERLIRFPLVHGEFRVVGSDGTDLRIFMGLTVEVSGIMGDTVGAALVPAEQVA